MSQLALHISCKHNYATTTCLIYLIVFAAKQFKTNELIRELQNFNQIFQNQADYIQDDYKKFVINEYGTKIRKKSTDYLAQIR